MKFVLQADEEEVKLVHAKDMLISACHATNMPSYKSHDVSSPLPPASPFPQS
jgi:hypothetical protein